MAIEEMNVAQPERWFSVVAGSALAAYGLKSRSLPGLVAAALGGVLVWRGATGHCPLYEALGVSTAPEHAAAPHPERSEDKLPADGT